MIELRRLRAFVVLAEEGHVTRRHGNARHALAKPAQHGGHKRVQGGGAGKAHRQPPLLPGRGAAQLL